MKRYAYFRRSLIPFLALPALTLLPLPGQAQTSEIRERREETLRRLEERLARVREREAERLARIEILEQERRTREEGARREREALALTVRERMEADRARMAERVREAQQVVVRVRTRVRLGVSLDPTQDEEYDRRGALLTGVTEGSPADEAGLREGDIITHLDGRSLLSPIPEEDELEFGEETSLPVQRLIALARELEDGQEVEVEYLRDGNSHTVTLEAADMDDRWVTVRHGDLEGRIFNVNPEGRFRWLHDLSDEDFEVLIEPWSGRFRDLEFEIPEFEFDTLRLDSLRGIGVWRGEGPNALVFRRGESPNIALFNRGENLVFGLGGSRAYGLELRELNPGLGEYFSTDRGVLVLMVDDDSGLGLRPGDVILSIGERGVEDPADVTRILRSYEEGETVLFTVMRHGEEVRVEGTMG